MNGKVQTMASVKAKTKSVGNGDDGGSDTSSTDERSGSLIMDFNEVEGIRRKIFYKKVAGWLPISENFGDVDGDVPKPRQI